MMEGKKNFSPKAIAFDLDDTLLRDDLSISDFTVQILSKLHGKGVLIIPASGRTRVSMSSFVERLNCVDQYIACNGAEIWSGKDHSLLRRETFPLSTAHQIIEFGRRHHCYAQTYDEGKFYFNQYCAYADAYARASSLKGEFVGDLDSFVHDPCCKFLMMDEPEKISAMLEEARQVFNGKASVTCSKPHYLEFNPPNATKAKALEVLLSGKGLSLSEVIAFGDSLNDWSMLSACGLGICVANARPELLERCDDTCPSNQEDGVARYLQKHVLQEMSL